MYGALLNFDGVAKLAGSAKATEDYFEFCTESALSDAQLNELHRATIEIDGRVEGVLVESTDRLDPDPEENGLLGGLMLTLRRNIEPAGSPDKLPPSV